MLEGPHCSGTTSIRAPIKSGALSVLITSTSSPLGRRFLCSAVLVATLFSVLVAAGAAEAYPHWCKKNYYPCTLNHGGVIDPANPGCCWSPLAGPPDGNLKHCPGGFYKCDLNDNGRLDPKHPGCCLRIL